MSFKTQSAKSTIKVTLDTKSLRNLTPDHNNLLVYTLLTFLLVLGIYFLTKDWKGFTAPEEVDIGSVRLTPRSRCRRKTCVMSS